MVESFFSNSKRDRLVMIAADIIAMTVFSFVLCLFIEVFIAGLTVFQSLQARAAAIPVNLLTGRPYGCFRDWLFQSLGIERKTPLKAVMGDTLAFVLFQVPLYVLVLLFAGATWRQIFLSSAFMTAIFSLAGRPYGLFLDLCRRLALRIAGSLDHAREKRSRKGPESWHKNKSKEDIPHEDKPLKDTKRP